MESLQTDGTLQSVQVSEDMITYTKKDGKAGGIIIRREVSKNGKALLGCQLRIQQRLRIIYLQPQRQQTT